MGIADIQIKNRKKMDSRIYKNTLDALVTSVIGRKVNRGDENYYKYTAIESVLRYLGYEIEEGKEKDFNTLDEYIGYYTNIKNIPYRKVLLKNNFYKNSILPYIVTYKNDTSKVVALIPGGLYGYHFIDSDTGKKTRVNKKNSARFSEEAYMFYKPLPNKKMSYADFFRFLFGELNIFDCIIFLLLMCATVSVTSLTPHIINLLYGDVLNSKNMTVLIAISAFYISYNIGNLIFNIYKNLIGRRISIRQSIIVEAAFMNRLMSLPTQFFRNFTSGELIQRFMYIKDFCVNIFQNTLLTIASAIFSLRFVFQLFELTKGSNYGGMIKPAIIILLITVIHAIISIKVSVDIHKKTMELHSKTSGLTYAIINGIQKIKIAGAEKRAFSKWGKKFSEVSRLTYNPPLYMKYARAITFTISTLGVFWLYKKAVDINMPLASFLAFNTSFGLAKVALDNFTNIANIIAKIKPMFDMIKPILEAEPEINEDKNKITNIKGFIELNNISFKYNENTSYILNDISLKISAGEYVAIVGKTGCGKSTIVRLLLGFEKAKIGDIYYDNISIDRLDIKSLRKNIGVVMQNGNLFNGDIYSNITISSPEATLNDAWEAAEIAKIADDIRNMPMGMYTMISDGQGGISGGQKQRIMIARALCRKPKVLIFDEATSALDNITQKAISDAIDKLQCTRIVIAHRLSTVKNADRILVMDNGKIVEEGNYEELINKKGYFTSLVEGQTLK